MDLFLEFGDDFKLAQTGDLILATGWDEVRQRIIRRLFTNEQAVLPGGQMQAADYIFDVNYGFGIGRLVDKPFTQATAADFVRRITAAAAIDAAVDSRVPPQIIFERPSAQQLVVGISVALRDGSAGTIPFAMPISG